MPAYIRGRVTVARAAGAYFGGDVSLRGDDGAYVSGWVSLGTALSDSCAAATRHVGCTVSLSIGGAWVPLDGVTGVVSWGRSLDVVADWARFSLADSRVARYHASSIAAGGMPVRIDLRVRSTSGDATVLAFLGTTVASSNAEPLRPVASMRAEGLATAWGRRGRRASVTRPAAQGMSRGAVLAAWATAAGLSTDGMVIPAGGRVSKAIDLVSLTGQDLLARYGLVEGWHFRPRTDGTIEILEAGYTDGGSRYDFTASNYYSLAERLPDRPATYYTLTGAQLDEEKLAQRRTVTRNGATASGGSVEVTIQYEGAAEVYRTWRTDAGTLRERKYEVTTEWNRDAEGRPTGQMSARHTVVSGWLNPEVALVDGTICYDGKYHLACSWTWGVMQTIDEALTWGDCYLEVKVTTAKRYYAPLGLSSNGAANCLRQDGSYRSVAAGQTADALIETSKEVVEYQADDSTTVKRVEVWGWGLDGEETDAGPPAVTVPVESYRVVQLLAGAAARNYAGGYTASAAGANGGVTSQAQSGALPRPPAARANEPQHRLDPMQLTFEVSGSGYPYAELDATIAEAQTMAELRMAAEVIAAVQLGTRYAVEHPGVAGLEPGDPVTLTATLKRDSLTGDEERVRALDAVAGYVDDIEWSYDTASGAFDARTEVLVPWRRTA